MAGKKRQKPRKKFIATNECPFCKAKVDPSYKDYQRLADLLTARSAITPKKYSGVCSNHQRQLGREIKRARTLGLLPFLPQANI